mgnify:CR=1 FL=1
MSDNKTGLKGLEVHSWDPYAGVDTPNAGADTSNAGVDTPSSPAEVERRTFLGLLGSTAAGLAMQGCIRKPVENILPYSERPEDLVPGVPLFYSTSMNLGDSVLGLRVESSDGRPTRISGNPRHPTSRGGAHVWAQAAIMDLYDDDRSRSPVRSGADIGWDECDAAVQGLAGRLAKSEGQGLALLMGATPSPTMTGLLGEMASKLPKARLFVDEPTGSKAATDGAELAGGGRLQVRYDFAKALRVLALDADPFGTEGDVVVHARDFAAGRKAEKPTDSMNRLYVIEPSLTVSGAMADNRLRLAAGSVGDVLVALAKRLDGIEAGNLPSAKAVATADKFIAAVANDLKANKGQSVVVVGPRQPAHVHALAHLVNQALGAVGKTVHYQAEAGPEAGTLQDLADAIGKGEIVQLVILGGDPAYTAPVDLQFGARLREVPLVIHLADRLNKTGELSQWRVPRTHFLEAWGDHVASDGTVSIQQPLIAPLHGAWSDIELTARLLGQAGASGHALVRKHHGVSSVGFGEKRWRRALHDGVVADASAGKPAQVQFAWAPVVKAWPASTESKGLEVDFMVDYSVLDGRYGNNPWLQENPDPVTKLTWDNAACISPATGAKLGLKSGDLGLLEVAGRSMKIAVWIARGVADDVVVVPLGYGQRHGRIAKTTGFDGNQIRNSKTPWFAAGGKLGSLGRQAPAYALATTQDKDSMFDGYNDRPIVREATLTEFTKDPTFVNKSELLPPERIHSLWEHPNETKGNQWGMSIDLNSCTGCGACTIACQAENNIPVVGKEEILNGREMHWLRIDRYFTGDENNPQMVVQPMACQHCETAPCENVCPVAATSHSPEGLNDMAYNRCIGTRYCANNCPYKVRRYNFYNYVKRNNEAQGKMIALQRNPDVTVRFRGVIEKCSYCVQRINGAKIEAKRNGTGRVADGKVATACQELCPTDSIVFGDVNDAKSAVSISKKNPRNYAVLAELNVQPRTTYLARIRNPNPELV